MQSHRPPTTEQAGGVPAQRRLKGLDQDELPDPGYRWLDLPDLRQRSQKIVPFPELWTGHRKVEGQRFSHWPPIDAFPPDDRKDTAVPGERLLWYGPPDLSSDP